MGQTDERVGISRVRDSRVASARTIANLLDTAVGIPGTKVRFGLDALLGLIPGLGDTAGAVFSGYLVLLASRLGAPRHVITRMVANVAIDTIVGAVPVLGDIFDVAWKSNTRNLALLEKHTGEAIGTEKPVSKVLVAAALLALVLLIAGGIWLAIIAVRWLIASVS